MRKRILQTIVLTIVGLWLSISVSALISRSVWSVFRPPELIGEKAVGIDIENIGIRVTEAYFEKLKGWKVPYDYRIIEAKLERVEILKELEEDYVQLDYKVRAASACSQVISNLGLVGAEELYTYYWQTVLHFEKKDGIWTVDKRMRPVEYQLQSPSMIEEFKRQQTQHYKMQTNKEMGYYIRDGVLQVTYDGGETFKEVKDGYEMVCITPNGTYDELLMENSYIVTPEFTAFVAYPEEGVSLLYSTDEGSTWKTSKISDMGYRANTFVSKSESKYYVTSAVDRTGGSDYYVTFVSEDLKTWTRIHQPEWMYSNLSCVYWNNADVGYYAKGDLCYMSKDGGNSFSQMQIPMAEEIVSKLGFNPFDTIEMMYEENGITYMVIGQGDDGDYAKDGKIIKALFRSEDGEIFTFAEEIMDSVELAG